MAAEPASPPTIWVDADACPAVIKEILFRASKRTGIAVTLVANHFMRVPAYGNVRLMQVASGFDVADNAIVQRVARGDLVITNDIPLAAELLPKGATVISPRGEPFDAATIGAKLTMRDFMETMRSSGVEVGGGPPALSQADRQAFAAQLDRYLARQAAG